MFDVRICAGKLEHHRMNTRAITSLACLLLFAGCAGLRSPGDQGAMQKIELDLTQLDAEGLRGPADGKVAVSYEFAIPNTAAHRAEVKAIDHSVQFMAGSRGRIGATREQCLCIGSTHQANYAAVLRSLAELPYVQRIIECHFE